ncbi:DUF6101 family protein [Methylobacterium persicinum]|uniref:Uncharacterized protein n=1 Tax=Methylobacterium persicinum TaxID=374426 RepID=A0ABU0HIW8_9HYPH|nr:DUF6101 family protein [Methylobacterium persicinum]MDQ0442262.1 hypothetical protein [Methylobacterium persicinum]GJE37279.1 hypothetical protein KHHGKMAE_1335 [Methylobacterium persicinum]
MDTRTDSHAPALAMPAFEASPLPVIGRLAAGRRAVGVALCYAEDEADLCDEDRFLLLLVDAEGDVLQRLGPFTEEDVVATWRALAGQAGLVRMIIREDGVQVPVSQQVGRLMLGRIRIRRRHAGLGARRPRFLARRKTGRLPARPQIFRGEAEIIARS